MRRVVTSRIKKENREGKYNIKRNIAWLTTLREDPQVGPDHGGQCYKPEERQSTAVTQNRRVKRSQMVQVVGLIKVVDRIVATRKSAVEKEEKSKVHVWSGGSNTYGVSCGNWNTAFQKRKGGQEVGHDLGGGVAVLMFWVCLVCKGGGVCCAGRSCLGVGVWVGDWGGGEDFGIGSIEGLGRLNAGAP